MTTDLRGDTNSSKNQNNLWHGF